MKILESWKNINKTTYSVLKLAPFLISFLVIALICWNFKEFVLLVPDYLTSTLQHMNYSLYIHYEGGIRICRELVYKAESVENIIPGLDLPNIDIPLKIGELEALTYCAR